MSIERDGQYGKITFVCDSCPATFEGGFNEGFTEVWERAKREGWTARKIAGEWLHSCEDCEPPT